MKILDQLNDFIAISNDRLDICKSCERYIHSLSVCNYCVCFMPAKVKFPTAECPVNKWGSYKYDKHNSEV